LRNELIRNGLQHPTKNYLELEVKCLECPYCKKQMKLGTIDVYDTLSWSPEGEDRKGATKYALAEHGILLARYCLLLPASIDAFYCADCKKIIININQ
jgi:hypothetical protein